MRQRTVLRQISALLITGTKSTLLQIFFNLSGTQTSVTRSVYLLCGITNGQLLKTSVWDNPASADTSLQSASLLIMQRAPFTGLSLLPAAQLGVSLIRRLQWSTANACLQSVSTEPFTQLAGVTPYEKEGERLNHISQQETTYDTKMKKHYACNQSRNPQNERRKTVWNIHHIFQFVTEG